MPISVTNKANEVEMYYYYYYIITVFKLQKNECSWESGQQTNTATSVKRILTYNLHQKEDEKGFGMKRSNSSMGIRISRGGTYGNIITNPGNMSSLINKTEHHDSLANCGKVHNPKQYQSFEFNDQLRENSTSRRILQ